METQVTELIYLAYLSSNKYFTYCSFVGKSIVLKWFKLSIYFFVLLSSHKLIKTNKPL